MKRLLCVIPLLLLFCPSFGCKQGKNASAEKEAEPAIIVDTAISSDGIPISYEVRGRGEPALIFVHGWCCDRSYWNNQLPYFAQRYKVVSIDLAGHGESGLDRKEWTMGRFGEDIVAVVRKLGLDKIVLVGHSMGGPVILEAGRRLPEGVIGLVVVDFLNDFEEKFSQETLDKSLGSLRSDFAGSVKKEVAEGMFTKTSDAALVEKIATDMSSAPPAVGIGEIEKLFDWLNNDLIRVLREVKAPITCINSDVYPTKVEINQRYAPSFKAKIMSGVGHFNMIEAPEIFNSMLEETVKEYVQISAKR